MKQNRYMSRRLKGKIILLIFLVIVFVGTIFYTQWDRAREKKQYEEYVKAKQEETQTDSGLTEDTMQELPENVKQSVVEKDSASVFNESKKVVKDVIVNLDEFATELMGSQTLLLEQRLKTFIKENNLNADSAEILQVMIPEEDSQSICFFVRLNDADSTIVTLTYHPAEQLVTSEHSIYSEEEISQCAWEGNAPLCRDVADE